MENVELVRRAIQTAETFWECSTSIRLGPAMLADPGSRNVCVGRDEVIKGSRRYGARGSTTASRPRGSTTDSLDVGCYLRSIVRRSNGKEPGNGSPAQELTEGTMRDSHVGIGPASSAAQVGGWRAPLTQENVPIASPAAYRIGWFVMAWCRGALLAGLLIALYPGTAWATYPGVNGPLTVSNGVKAFTLSPDGSSLKSVVRTGAEDGVEELVLSPDGKRIAYVKYHEGSPCERFCTYYSRVWVARRNGDHPRPVSRSGTQAESPVFSPNGRSILWKEGDSIWAAGANTKRKHLLFSAADVGLESFNYYPFDLSPNGRKIAVGGYDGSSDHSRIFVMPADGKGQAAAVSPPGPGLGDFDPSWSPDGRRIAFTRYCANPACNNNVFVVRADGSGAFELSQNDPDRYDDSAVWSPDGRRIAFMFIDTTSYGSGIAVRRAVANSPVKVLTRKSLDLFAWAPLP